MEVFKNRPDTVKGPANKFTGDVYLDYKKMLSPTVNVQVGHVHFSPCARTAWHKHPFGQTLIVTDGVGWVQNRGGNKIEIRPGDVVLTEPNEEHWHGASAGNLMAHYAINAADQDGNSAYWGEHVTDEEYFA
jgi:quercetin dioxygenase-like cupin family protein